MQAGPYDNLKEIALKILQNGISTVPIIHSSSEDDSFPQLLHLASLSGILKCKFFSRTFFICMFVQIWLILTKLVSQAFAGILGIVLVHCPYFNFQSVQSLWVRGCPKLGRQIASL